MPWLAAPCCGGPGRRPRARGRRPSVWRWKPAPGRIVIELHADKAPKTVANFLQYVKDGFYDGTIFHRVIDRFMIQGGGFTEAMMQKPHPRADPRREPATA